MTEFYPTKKGAQAAATRWLNRLPPGMFRVDIWENDGGWYWALILNCEDLHVWLVYHPDRRDFGCAISHVADGVCDGEYVNLHRCGTDPIRLAEEVLRNAQKTLQVKLSQLRSAYVDLLHTS